MRLLQFSLLTLTLLGSCVGPQALQYRLNENKVNLNYTFDSPIDTVRGSNKLFIKVIDGLTLNDSTRVENNGGLVVPLGIGGGYKYDFTVTLGKKSVHPSFSEFLKNSFQTEAERTGHFQVMNKPHRSYYILEIRLTECQISAQYHKDRIRFGHNNKENGNLKPVTGKFSVEVQLLKKKKSVYNKVYWSNKTAQSENQIFSSEYMMNKKMMDDFAKTASLEIKEINEQIIIDINEFLNQNTASIKQ
jgi:hypothetical protein